MMCPRNTDSVIYLLAVGPACRASLVAYIPALRVAERRATIGTSCVCCHKAWSSSNKVPGPPARFAHVTEFLVLM